MLKQSKRINYIAFVSSLGAALEYYCFIIYILLSSYLGKIFFAAHDERSAVLNTLLVFAIGYIVTPISAFSFSFIADRIGRKLTMLLAIVLMASATFLIGVLPGYRTAGILAPILLVILRITQGMAQGAELPAAIAFLNEHAEDKRKAFYSGILFFAVGTGALLSTFVNYVLTNVLNENQMLAYGWRIPFLLAGVLGIIGYKIRANTLETPQFLEQKKIGLVKIPIVTVFKEHLPQVLTGFGLVWSGAALVNFGLYLPSFLQTNFGYQAKDTYLAMTVTFVIDFLLIVFGAIADRISLKKFYLIGILVNIVFFYPVFSLFKLHSLPALYIAYMLSHLLILLLAACYPTMIANLFPTKVRYTGIAVSYLGAYSLAGVVPFVVNQLYVHYSSVLAVSLFFVFSGLLSLIAVLYYKEVV